MSREPTGSPTTTNGYDACHLFRRQRGSGSGRDDEIYFKVYQLGGQSMVSLIATLREAALDYQILAFGIAKLPQPTKEGAMERFR